MRERNRAHGSCYFLTFFFFESGSDYFDVVFVQSESTVKRQPGPLNLGDAVLDLSSKQKATLGTGRVYGSGPSGTSWHGVLVW